MADFSLLPLLPGLIVTAFYAAILTLLTLALAFRVSWLRWRHGVGLGDAGRADLARAIRAHGNATEYIPLGILLLALDSVAGIPLLWIEIAGGLLFFGRLSHAYGISISSGRSVGRFTGTLATWLSLLMMTIALFGAIYRVR